jgi:hypothetical protein
VKPVGASPAGALGAARLALAVVLGLRLALSPFAAAVGQPDALWRPRGTGLLFPTAPPAAVVLGLQVVGVAGATLYVWRRRLPPLVVSWACLLLLAGLRTSLGKVLHNDALLLLAAGPVLLAGSGRGGRSVAAGAVADDPARTGLDAAAAIVIVSYFCTAWWKLVHAGPAWALSDNLRWALASGRGGSRWPAFTSWLVAHPAVCVALACGILALELGAPILWLRPRLAPWYVAGAALLHAGTWVVLGLDYWVHLAIVALVLLPWARMRRR